MYLQTTVQEESKNVKEDISERFDHLKVRFNFFFQASHFLPGFMKTGLVIIL